MAETGSASFERHFQELPDPRVERTRKHPLVNIVFMAVCGVLSGANSIAAIHEFALDRRHWFARYLDLTNGIPSEDTIGRVLARVEPGAFEKCLLSWVQAVQEVTAHRLVSIDGKTLRGSADIERGRAAIHMVSEHDVDVIVYIETNFLMSVAMGAASLGSRKRYSRRTRGTLTPRTSKLLLLPSASAGPSDPSRMFWVGWDHFLIDVSLRPTFSSVGVAECRRFATESVRLSNRALGRCRRARL